LKRYPERTGVIMHLKVLSLLLPAALVAQTPPTPVQSLLQAAKAEARRVASEKQAFITAGKNSKDFHPELGKPLAELELRLATEKSPEIRQTLLVLRYYYQVLGRHPRPASTMLAILAEVPGDCPAWSVEADLLADFKEEQPDCKPYALKAMDIHPDPEVRKSLIFDHFWDMVEQKNETEWRKAFERLQKEFPEAPQTRKAKEILEGELKTGVGRPAPAFSVAALGHPGTTYSLESFKGSYVLIDFWATWCPSCRAELPSLHKAWTRFQGKNLQILSLSFDRKVEHIAPLRKQAATPMPWKHAFVEGGFSSELAKAYGVKGIPKAILVGPDGIILATGADVRGENLEKTLAKHLK